ncbi:hypothetical protein [Polyangium mundeleinium]|uniref:Uncharacterized protein n=1 Tax=Polyangium mundeleinium TaxID=2995306 RepID=A0ABT5ESK6_9BACT|nr:hypothetical protein [Polyangium mundeleinium]MDC0744344.1 hypothetical protein [Polyangium mundeleinium]
MRSFGQDPAPFRLEGRALSAMRACDAPLPIVYRFERESSGTTVPLRAVSMVQKLVVAVGDRGVALRREDGKGWQREATGTTKDLFALVPVSTGPMGEPDMLLAVGAHGTAAARMPDGTWRIEETGTDEDLLGLYHDRALTLAFGAGGVILRRFGNGNWKPVPSSSTADLHAFNACSPHRLCVLGSAGAIVECDQAQTAGELSCKPRPPFADGDLPADFINVFHRDPNVVISSEMTAVGMIPLSVWKLWRRDGNSAPPADAMEAGWQNKWSGDRLVVGRGGAVWHGWLEKDKRILERIKLPVREDLHGAVFDGADGFLVGDQGTILHVAVEGLGTERMELVGG